MPGNMVIGSLRINLGMNSAEFSKDVKTINKRMDRFQRQMAGVAKVAAAAFAGLAVAAGAAFTSVSQHADKMAKSAQKIGIPIEELSVLSHAAELSGVSFANLETGIGRFSSNITDSLNGLSSEGSKALSSLDIALKRTDGTTKSTSEIMGDIAERFKSMPDGAEKTAIAMRVFGKSGRDLIPMLNQGRDGIKAMTDEAKKLGLQISGETGMAAEAFNDNITRVQQALRGVAIQVVSKVLPVMKALSDRFIAAVTEGGAMESIVNVLTGAFNGLIRVVLFVVDHMGTLYKLFKVFVAAQVIGYVGAVAKSFYLMGRAIKVSGLALGAFSAIQRISMKGILLVAGAIAIATGQYSKLETAMTGLWDKVKNLLPKDLSKSVDDFFSKISLGAGDAKIELGALELSARNAADSFAPVVVATTKLGSAMSGLGSKTGDAWKGLRKVSQVAQDTLAPIVGTIQSSFDTMFDGAVEGTLKLNESLRDLGKQLLKMAAKRAFMSLLTGGMGGGLGGGFSLPGFANGGSFNVGGSGGIDSQLVAFRASPNERVSITKPGQNNGGQSSISVTNNINATGADPAQLQRVVQSVQQLAKDVPKMVDQRNNTRQIRNTRA